MTEFFKNVSLDQASRIEQLSRLMYELRENRLQLLADHEVSDEAALLERIRIGAVPEHPAYEAYLGARVLAESYAAVRVELQEATLVAQRS